MVRVVSLRGPLLRHRLVRWPELAVAWLRRAKARGNMRAVPRTRDTDLEQRRRRGASYLRSVVLRASLLLALTLLVASRAAALAPSGSEEERRALYQQGLELAEAGRWKEAVERFRRVVEIRSAPKALFTLAEAEEKAGLLATAKATYARALAEARSKSDEDVARAASSALEGIDWRVPHVVVHVPAGISGARVSIDGRDVAPGQPVDVDPGTRSVRVRAPGRLDFVEEVSASEARQIEIHARLDPETSPSPETVRPAPARNVPTSDRRVSVADGSGGPPAGAIVVGGLGLTLATVGFLIPPAWRIGLRRCQRGVRGGMPDPGSRRSRK